MSKKITAKEVNRLSKKSGFSASFIFMAFQMGIMGAYEFFNNAKKK